MMKIVKGRIWCEVFDVESEELAVQTFNDIFVKPMTIGQYLDATPEQMTCMLYRSYVLHYLLKSYIHRRNGLHLIGMPEKMECVLYVCLTDVQKSLYEVNYLFIFFYVSKTSKYVSNIYFSTTLSKLKRKDLYKTCDQKPHCFGIKIYSH